MSDTETELEQARAAVLDQMGRKPRLCKTRRDGDPCDRCELEDEADLHRFGRAVESALQARVAALEAAFTDYLDLFEGQTDEWALYADGWEAAAAEAYEHARALLAAEGGG